MSYEKTIYKVWEQWDRVHEKRDQLSRLSRSTSSDYTPLEINVDNDVASASFLGSKANVTYKTYLNSCDCTDFIRRKLPCKHMYRLASELGIIDVKFKSSIAPRKIIPSNFNEIKSYETIVAEISQLSDASQMILKDFLCDFSYNKITQQHFKKSEELQALLSKNILFSTEDIDMILDKSNIEDLKCMIFDYSNVEFKKGTRQTTLLKWISQNVPNEKLEEFCINYIVVSLSEEYFKYSRKVYLDLLYKYGDGNYFDPEINDFV